MVFMFINLKRGTSSEHLNDDDDGKRI